MKVETIHCLLKEKIFNANEANFRMVIKMIHKIHPCAEIGTQAPSEMEIPIGFKWCEHNRFLQHTTLLNQDFRYRSHRPDALSGG